MACQTQTSAAMTCERQTARSSSMRKSCHRSRGLEVAASGEKSSSLPPRRRERNGASREPRRAVNFAAGEIEELVKTSEMVPVVDGKARNLSVDSAVGKLVHSHLTSTTGSVGRVRKNSIDSDAASTMAPNSAEPSPMLGFVADGNASTWPSLREASSGWDFCSDASEDEDLWQDLPEPLIALDESPQSGQSSKKSDASPASWCYVPAGGNTPTEQTEAITSSPKISFADMVREQPKEQADHVSPPAPGALMPTIRGRPLQRRSGSKSRTAMCDGDDADEINDDLEDTFVTQYHGWTKDHKASRSARYQRVLKYQMALRDKQRAQSRKHCDGGELELDN